MDVKLSLKQFVPAVAQQTQTFSELLATVQAMNAAHRDPPRLTRVSNVCLRWLCQHLEAVTLEY
jgi:hypothetical protein